MTPDGGTHTGLSVPVRVFVLGGAATKTTSFGPEPGLTASMAVGCATPPSTTPAPPFVYQPTPLYRDPSFYIALLPGTGLWLFGLYGSPALIGWLT